MPEAKTTDKKEKKTISQIIEDYRQTHTVNETTAFIHGMMAYQTRR